MTIGLSTAIDRDGLWATRLLLLSVALLGIAHVAFLPPFEGVDEFGHWSYIQQLADTGLVPVLGVDKLSADVEAYPGPSFLSGGRVFRRYFAGPTPNLKESVERSYRPGKGPSWEAQHPPLFYALLTPFYLLARDWSWPSHLLLLRLVSWTMAFAGFAIGCRASQRAFAAMGGGTGPGLLIAAWPILFPQFFPEMARLGNDGLCLLFIGLGWHFLLRGLENPDRGAAVGSGIAFGLGLLTKAFFWPIGLGTAALLGFAGWRAKDRRYFGFAALAGAIAVAIGIGWYLRNVLVTGSFFSARDFLHSGARGGLVERWSAGNLAQELAFLLRQFAVIAGSFAWAGTRTLAMLPRIFTAPVFLLAALPLGLWLLRLPKLPTAGVAPLFLATPLLAGLIYHAIDQAPAGTDAIGTPGWYLHVAAGPLSLAFALGWRRNALFRFLLVYAVGFQAVCWATQLSVFSGCAYNPGAHQSLRLDPGSCLIDADHLAALGEPLLGAIALAGAVAAGIAALPFAARTIKNAGQIPAWSGGLTLTSLADGQGWPGPDR